MTYLILDAIALALLGGFYGFTWHEERRGGRFFGALRARFDQKVEQALFVLHHVDWNAFARTQLTRLAHRISHDTAHLSLTAVRAIERSLTQLVRRLRTQDASGTITREPARPFVKTLSDFKEQLSATRPEMPEVL